MLIPGLLHSRNEASQFEIFEDLYFPMPCAICWGHESEQNSGEEERQSLKTTYLALPLHVKCAAERFNNYRPYITAGISPMVNLTVKKQRPILFKKFDCMFEVGFGCDFYLPFFKLIPELKFAFSLVDVLDKDRKDLLDDNLLKYTQSVDKIVSKMIVLSFYFE